MHSRIAIYGALWLLGTSGVVQAQQGHSVSGNKVVVDQIEQWQQWEFPYNTVDITADGVTPHFWRSDTNAMLEIVDNLRANPPSSLASKDPEEITVLDAIDALSNREDIVNLFDGDMATYWEPEFPKVESTELSNVWWFTIDLGRVVLAKKIVLRFVDEDLGDPFQMFEVLTSDGQKPLKALAGKSLEFSRIFRTLQPNKTQREFEFDLTGLSGGSLGEAGTSTSSVSIVSTQSFSPGQSRKRVVRMIQVKVNESGLRRGREITQEEFEQLRTEAPGDTGFVEYNKLLSTGGELPVSKAIYDKLYEDRKGSVRYFRRERPRLAELEVWGEGDDVFAGTIQRGGTISATDAGQFDARVLLDSDILSNLALKVWIPNTEALLFGNIRQEDVFADLGGFFWIDRQRMTVNFRPSGHSGTWGEYWLEFSDGSREIDGSLKWITKGYNNEIPASGNVESIVASSEGQAHIRTYYHDFEPVKAKFMRVHYTASGDYPSGPSTIYLSDIQLLGHGYQPEVTLTSDLIRLGGTRNLSTIEWDADLEPGTRVVLQTRTGNTLDTLLHYFKADGTEITEAQYNKIRIRSQKGDIVPEEVASADWEPWSTPYETATGSDITSPSPREFMKIRATLLSDDPMARPELRAVRVNFASPLASKLEGRVLPTLVDSLGVNRLFSLFVDIESLESGFDEVLIEPPPGMELFFDPASESLYTGMASDFDGNTGLESLALESVQVLSQGDNLHLSFPEIGEAEVLRVDFQGKLFSSGGRMRVSLGSSARDGLWQRVDEEVPRNSLQLVALPESKDVFQYLTITPRVFSPNEDGINDEMVMEFTLVLVGSSTAVEAEIFDLTGRLVRSLEQQRAVSTGRYTIPWDGKDDGGNRLPPGLYAVRLRLDTDTDGTGIERREMVRTVGLGY